jgi:hypothetical protein
VTRKDRRTSAAKAVSAALALVLALGGCARPEFGGSEPGDDYVFPEELVAAGAQTASNTTTTTTVPMLSEEPEPEVPPPPAAAEALEANARPLALPSAALLPGVDRLEPSIVTPDGERRLLQDVLVDVSYDPDTGLVVDPAGWWVINYPLDRLADAAGRSVEEVSEALLGTPLDEVTNYYFYTAPTGGAEVPEPPPAVGPAPIRVTPAPDLVVNNQHPKASDENPGTSAEPLLTISEAVSRAVPGSVIHVYPGTYRESVVVDADGQQDAPIQIQGIRGASGAMPLITGDDPLPAGAWTEVDGLRGVYRTDDFTGLPGSLVVDGDRLVERSAPWDLDRGEYVLSNGSEAYIDPRFDGDARAREGSVFDFGESKYIWEVKPTDAGGFVDLGSEFGEDFAGGVFWGSAWVWVDRPSGLSDHEWYRPYDFDLQVSGPFRAGRITGLPLDEQPYSYHIWLDGEPLMGNIYDTAENGEASLPHPELGRGQVGETWHGVVMDEGWHHLVFQWDTTGESSADPTFRFGIPEVIGTAVSSAAQPARTWRAPSGEPLAYISEYMVLGPVPANDEPTVYLRLEGDEDPNDHVVEMAARSGPVVSIRGDFVEFEGFDVRGGAQQEGQSLIAVGRRSDDPSQDAFVQGAVVAGNLVTGSEYGGIGVAVEGDQGVAPIVITNNWVTDAGAVGIWAAGSSNRLTADTLNDWAPGRTRVSVTNNRIVNAGWAGYSRQRDVSAIKFERMTGSSIMYNTIVGGGPGITLRAESYANRVDGNRVIDPWGWGIGVEANPGPNVVANNVITGLRAGPEWLKAHLLTWDSDRTFLINNTTDGEWRNEIGWYGDVGNWGAGGPDNFDRVEFDTWDLTIFRRTYINNLLLGSYLGGIEDYEGNWGETDTFNANYREVPSPDPFDYFDDGAEKANVRWAFVDRDDGDYRLVESSDLNTLGVVNQTSRLATHDFYGFIRENSDGAASVGAFRAPVDVAVGSSVIEVEFRDGSTVIAGG